jgi:hypothetical protein
VLTRSDIIAALRDTIVLDQDIRAAWLGGSDATARTDDLSDIDLVIIARDDAIAATFQRLEAAMEDRLGGIDLRFVIPQPSWHGHEQCFYRLKNAAPEHLIDVAVIKESAPQDSRFLEVQRHGHPLILVDRDNLTNPAPFDRPAHLDKMHARLQALKVRFELFQVLVTKAIARNQPLDALAFYHSWTLLPLVEVLRMLHCPDRYDYGLRYLDTDLPPDTHATLHRLAYHASLPTLATHHAEAVHLFRETVSQLERT